MSFKFTVSTVLPASPKAIYDAWMSSKGHGAMTNAKAKVSARPGGKFTATDEYVWGTNLELVPAKKIVQSWRSSDFAEGDKDSKISVALKPVAGGTKLTLLHSAIPDSQKELGYAQGWEDYYFAPMQAYFAKVAAKAKPKKAAKKTMARKPAAKA